MTYRTELRLKLNSLVNRYGGDAGFVANMHQWPRTVKALVYNSNELMIRFGLMEPTSDPVEDETTVIGIA